MADYADLEIRILERQEGGFPVELTLNGAQEFPRGYLDPAFLPWVPGASPAEDGERLFAWLFADGRLQAAWAQVRGQQPQRRIRLRIDASAPELHAIPWELLRDTSESGDAQVLGAAVATPFSRYLAGGWEPGHPVQALPLKILVVIANPEGLEGYQLEPVEFEREWSNLQAGTAALASARALELVPLFPPVTLGQIEAELKNGYHILHLVGHGKYPQRPAPGRDQASLFLADENNRVKRVTETELAGMLGRQIAHVEATGKPSLRFVFLASCETARRSDADAFCGMAPRLVQGSLPAVLAMQGAVEIEAAREFARVFYRQLLSHGQVDLACNEARSALLTGEFGGAYIPVLFSRLPGNLLLDPSILRGPWRPLDFEPEVLYVRSGEFYMGGSPHDPHVKEWEMPAGSIDLPAFCIGRYPVTNRQYWAFVKASGHDAPRINWAGRRPRENKLDHPVVEVNWYDACAYCAWLSERTGRRYRLPSEAEWEKAARGMDDRRIYPWGDTWQPDRCNHDGDETTEVGAFGPQSPFGCCDMVGNVREWTTTVWGGNSHEAYSDYPYPWKRDGRDALGQDGQLDTRYRICRGGSYAEGPSRLRCSERDWYAPDARSGRTGFRVVMEIG